MADIPDDVRRFVLANIPSVPYLEALLLLRAEPHRAFDCDEVARALYLPAPKAEELIAALAEAGVVQPAEPASAPRYCYAPQDEALAEVIGRLAEVYPKNLIPITNMIHAAAAAGTNARRFADAFKLRKDR